MKQGLVIFLHIRNIFQCRPKVRSKAFLDICNISKTISIWLSYHLVLVFYGLSFMQISHKLIPSGLPQFSVFLTLFMSCTVLIGYQILPLMYNFQNLISLMSLFKVRSTPQANFKCSQGIYCVTKP